MSGDDYVCSVILVGLLSVLVFAHLGAMFERRADYMNKMNFMYIKRKRMKFGRPYTAWWRPTMEHGMRIYNYTSPQDYHVSGQNCARMFFTLRDYRKVHGDEVYHFTRLKEGSYDTGKSPTPVQRSVDAYRRIERFRKIKPWHREVHAFNAFQTSVMKRYITQGRIR